MTRRDLSFAPKDEPLRADVSTLGALVGEVIREQGGEALFARVEAARRAAIRRREGESGGAEALREAVCELSPRQAAELVRAFATYFRVVNLAEQVHRIRRRRDYQRQGQSPQPGSLEDALGRLAGAGVGAGELGELLGRLAVEPVFTAHPTEATRRVILEKEQRIARRLVERLDPSRTPAEERAALEHVRAEVTAAWQTEEHPEERPRVLDEAEHVLFYVTDVLYRVIPRFYEELEGGWSRVYGDAPGREGLPTMVRFASWVGGDMDGNPHVTAQTLRDTLDRQRYLVLELYRRELGKLAGRLTQSTSRVGVDGRIKARIQRTASFFPDRLATIPARQRDMPYRTLLTLMARRLEATRDDEPTAYGGPEELLDDLGAIAASLEAHGGRRAGWFEVRRAIRRVETFGFHLATLDVRQEAAVHRRVVGRLLGEADWCDRPAGERAARLGRALESGETPATSGRETEDERTLAVFEAIAACRRRFGRHAIGPYIISMARDVDDVLAVLLLARWGGLFGDTGEVPLDIAPLFETVADLEAAPRVVERLLADPVYRLHLRTRGDRQMVMIGYSDSSKRGGLAASRWALHVAQAALAATVERAGVELTVFHGRGGTISRGGGKTHRALLAAPRGAVAGRVRMTEQGEVIHERYGLRAIALRTLERTVGASALATALDAGQTEERLFHEVMSEIAACSRDAFRALVYDRAEFADYFRQATPIDVIERMRIGSRPASRGSGAGIEELRAIPWVFAWTQSRHLLPGWYGLGSGLEAAVEAYGEETVAEVIRRWPFAANLVDDAAMVLAKADLDIAARYAALAGELGERTFPGIREEFERTVELLLRLTGRERLLADDGTLERSIRLRNPYVDPMSLLQVDLLGRWRAGARRDEDLFHALLSTVQGIAQGLRNTG